jgi:hypothetical protein
VRSSTPRSERDRATATTRAATGVATPAPTLESSEPVQISHGELEIVLIGTGFNSDSIVKVWQVAGMEEPRRVDVIGPTALKVTLEAKDIETPGVLAFVVINPEPGTAGARASRSRSRSPRPNGGAPVAAEVVGDHAG